MHEVKKPKKNLAYYYLIVLLALMLFNAFAMPYIAEQQVEEVDYGTFMSMTEKGRSDRLKSRATRLFLRIKTTAKFTRRG